MKKNSLNFKNPDAIIMDFDGVLTNNKVIINQKGEESVECSRSDGLAIEILNKLKIKIFILSTEKNKVVKERAKKLKVQCFNSVIDKQKAIISLSKKQNINLSRSIYIGNDVNDLLAMKECKVKICPKDSHPAIKKIANFITVSSGGNGVIREVVEKILKIDIVKFL